MNLVLGILWLSGAVFLFGYEAAFGKRLWSIRGFNDVSGAWILLLLAAWNFVRWFSTRMSRADREAMRIANEARARHSQSRQPEPLTEPDPTFDFSDKPPSAPGPKPPGERPPSLN
jgi:hypothetical protein